MRRIAAIAALALVLALAAPARAQAPVPAPLPDSVGVGTWSPGAKGETHHIKVDGEDIYLDGVLQEQRFRPGCVLVIADGKALCAPAAPGEGPALERLERRIELKRTR